MDLVQLVYFSRNTVAGDDRAHLQQLRDILKVSQANNQRDGLTGFLIFDKTWFVQILEGDRKAVTSAYDRIAKDVRHGRVQTLDVRMIQRRDFGQWTMGGAMRSLDQQEVFLRHGIGGAMDPTRMTAQAVVALARDLDALETARRQPARMAS
jgi:hypothetical protein